MRVFIARKSANVEHTETRSTKNRPFHVPCGRRRVSPAVPNFKSFLRCIYLAFQTAWNLSYWDVGLSPCIYLVVRVHANCVTSRLAIAFTLDTNSVASSRNAWPSSNSENLFLIMPTKSDIGSSENQCPTSSRVGSGWTTQVFQLNPLQDPRWKAFVSTHPDASVFHRVEWLEALRSCYGYVPTVFTLSRPGSRLENGIVFCEVRSPLTGKRLVSIPFSDHCEPLISKPEELELFMANLVERIEKNHWKYFEIRPARRTPDDTRNLGISQNYYFHRLDLRPSEEALFKKFHKDCVQRKIRRAKREDLCYVEGNSETLLLHFYNLMIMTRRRQGLPPQPFKWFRSLVTCMGKDAQIRLVLKGDLPVASILTLTNKRSLVYKYGCSDSRFSHLGGTAMLFWNAIQEAKANGLEEFDLGRSDIANTGLISFKEHWGAERSTVNYWRYPLKSGSSKPERLIRYTKMIISVVPDQALVMLGNLFYRHLG